MADFTVRFFICNIFICGIIGILMIVKRILRHHLPNRLQYRLWFVLLGLLAVPFLPFRPVSFGSLFIRLRDLNCFSAMRSTTAFWPVPGSYAPSETNWINDFAISVSRDASRASFFFFGIWIIGMFVMAAGLIQSLRRLQTLKKSALPLQNNQVRHLYHCCLEKTGITKHVPLFSTAFLQSPIITGLFRPCIYIPIQLISDYKETDMRYMLLHELQHYKHRDAIASHLMNIARTVYWFNPAVWLALKEMRSEREIACDTSVLELLEEDCYGEYGNTLINFAGQVSRNSFPFTTGLGGGLKQMQRRIANITSYEKPTSEKKKKGIAIFILTAILLAAFAPALSTYAAKTDHYEWEHTSENISLTDLSAYFGDYSGCFVLYDSANDIWRIHNMEQALVRISPNSTYKIYDALFGLEEGVITPGNSLLAWNGEHYPYAAWNTDHTLTSAMHSSVNWYFQRLDEQMGAAAVKSYIQEIGYGNEDLSDNFPAYWLESSLQISAVEQVEILTKLYRNDFDFKPAHINAVKASLLLSSTETGTLYGKTGTGRVDDADVNGWFVGCMETNDNAFFFAANIQAEEHAAGSVAADITRTILSDMNLSL